MEVMNTREFEINKSISILIILYILRIARIQDQKSISILILLFNLRTERPRDKKKKKKNQSLFSSFSSLSIQIPKSLNRFQLSSDEQNELQSNSTIPDSNNLYHNQAILLDSVTDLDSQISVRREFEIKKSISVLIFLFTLRTDSQKSKSVSIFFR